MEYTPEMNRGGGEIKREDTFFFCGDEEEGDP